VRATRGEVEGQPLQPVGEDGEFRDRLVQAGEAEGIGAPLVGQEFADVRVLAGFRPDGGVVVGPTAVRDGPVADLQVSRRRRGDHRDEQRTGQLAGRELQPLRFRQHRFPRLPHQLAAGGFVEERNEAGRADSPNHLVARDPRADLGSARAAGSVRRRDDEPPVARPADDPTEGILARLARLLV